MIYIGSRYQDTPVSYLLDGRTGKTHATVLRRLPEITSPMLSSRWRAGLRLDRMAGRMYGNESEWWLVLDVNSEILDPMSLAPGMTVRIP
jgi:hypothetical protein